MQRPGRKSAFSIEERRRIVAEYEQGDMSVKALCQKYGLRSHSIIYNWRQRCFSPESIKVVPLQSTQDAKDMNTDSIDDSRLLLEKIRDLEKRLKDSELRNKALNNLIDIAEEQGLKIRKNSGAKR